MNRKRDLDPLTPEQRRRVMAAVEGRDTKPGMLVRRMLHRMGYRFRLHVAALPGRPDLVFPSRRKVVFVHGCFWHRHGCRRGRSVPNNRRAFWLDKFAANVRRDRRDRRDRRRLSRDGWGVLVVWECRLADPGRAAGRLRRFLGPPGTAPDVAGPRGIA